MLQPVNIQVEFNQLLSIIKQCDVNQKIEIVKELENETFKPRFKKLLSELKDNDFTPEDITKEVERIRTKRYKTQKR